MSCLLLIILTLSRLVSYAFDHYEVLVWAFFFGLIVASDIYIGRQLSLRRIGAWVALAAGTLVALAISLGQLSMQLPTDWWLVAIAGSIAICVVDFQGVSVK